MEEFEVNWFAEFEASPFNVWWSGECINGRLVTTSYRSRAILFISTGDFSIKPSIYEMLSTILSNSAQQIKVHYGKCQNPDILAQMKKENFVLTEEYLKDLLHKRFIHCNPCVLSPFML